MCSGPVTVVLVVITLLGVFSATTQQQQREDQRPVLWRKFEDLLAQSDGKLYNLSMTFFSPGDSQYTISVPVSMSVGVTVDRINDTGFVPSYEEDRPALCCSTNMGFCTVWVNCRANTFNLVRPTIESGASQISDLLSGPEINSVFSALDPSFYYLMKKLSEESSSPVSILSFEYAAEINFHIEQLGVVPSESELSDALSAVLIWVGTNHNAKFNVAIPWTRD